MPHSLKKSPGLNPLPTPQNITDSLDSRTLPLSPSPTHEIATPVTSSSSSTDEQPGFKIIAPDSPPHTAPPSPPKANTPITEPFLEKAPKSSGCCWSTLSFFCMPDADDDDSNNTNDIALRQTFK